MGISSMERTRDDVKGLIQVIIKEGFKDSAVSSFKKLGVSNLSGIEDVELGLAYDTLLEDWGAEQLKRKPLGKFERFKYGKRWAAPSIEKKAKSGKVELVPIRAMLDVEIEMQCYLSFDPQMNMRTQKEYQIWVPGAISKYEHCKRGMEMIWGLNTRKPVVFSPYTERMLKALCEKQFLAIGGHASGGKTYVPAAWGVWNYLCFPINTKVLITSTSLKDSRGRIWGDVEEFWNAAADAYGGDVPGKLVSSDGTIRCVIGNDSTDKAGMTLVAGDKSEAAKSWNKIKGFKRPRFFFICDEMTDLSDNLLSSAESNLRNNHFFQMVGIGNPTSFYDPLGKMCEPKEGWSSVNESMFEWEGKKAFVIRFDARTSPNVLARKNIYKGLLEYQDYEDAKTSLGENSPGFYQMYRGFWCPTGSIESIYTESEIVTYGADRAVGQGWSWRSGFDQCWSLDPSFKHGGDDAIFTIGHVGNDSATGYKTFERKETIRIDVDVNNPLPKDEQVVAKVKELLVKKQLNAINGAVDVSGAASFGSLLRREIGDGWLAVEFGGKPSDMPASNTDKRPSSDIYDRMVAELWHVGKELMRNGQIRGLDADTITQMIARTYETRNGKIRVQPKEEMKKVTGKSPDRADSLFLCIFAARKRFDLSSKETSLVKATQDGAPVETPWAAWSRKMQEVDTFFGQTFTYGSG
jgi:hypothetical protein